MYTIAIFASGGGSNALEIIKHFVNSKSIRVGLIVSNNPKAGVKNHALTYGIPYKVISRSIWTDTPQVLIDLLAEKKIDFIVLAGFLQLIPKDLISAFPNRILNIHPALLPQFGGKGMYGLHVHNAVKASGCRESGISIHLVNEKYDDGKIIFQARVAIAENDTPDIIQKKVLALEHKWYPQVIEKYIEQQFQS